MNAPDESSQKSNRHTGRRKNTPANMKFSNTIRHYEDIHNTENIQFSLDTTAKKFDNKSKELFNISLSSLKTKLSPHKVQCVIFENTVGYAAATFVFCNF